MSCPAASFAPDVVEDYDLTDESDEFSTELEQTDGSQEESSESSETSFRSSRLAPIPSVHRPRRPGPYYSLQESPPYKAGYRQAWAQRTRPSRGRCRPHSPSRARRNESGSPDSVRLFYSTSTRSPQVMRRTVSDSSGIGPMMKQAYSHPDSRPHIHSTQYLADPIPVPSRS